MLELQQLLRPIWSGEKGINNAWSVLTDDEKQRITQRVNNLFENGLPLQLKHDNILYIHLFSLLAHLKIIVIHCLLTPSKALAKTPFKSKIQLGLMDDIFHAIVFSKIAYELSAPHALPPSDNKEIDDFICLHLNESGIETSLIWMNMIGQGWIDEIGLALKHKNIATNVFDVMIDDESRHMSEFDLYRQIGLPDKDYLNNKLAIIEKELIRLTFSQKKYAVTFAALLGTDGLLELINNIDKRHNTLLGKISFKPGQHWQFFMKHTPLMVRGLFHENKLDEWVEQTTTHKILSAAWIDPNQPTQYGLFSIDVTPVKFFEKKFPKETITCLSLQAVSKALSDIPSLKKYKSFNQIFHAKDSYVGLVVQLPGCADNFGMIEFKNCHSMSLSALSQHIQNDLQIMIYCHKKTQELQRQYPHFIDMIDLIFTSQQGKVYRELAITRPTISISNIGHFGYDSAYSPLLPDEAIKFVLTKIERKQVWNHEKNAFEIQDILPVSISVDHRIFDANTPVPKYFQSAFNDVFTIMQQTKPSAEPIEPNTTIAEFIRFSDRLLADDLEYGFRYLFFSAQIWKNYGVVLTEKTEQSFMGGLKKKFGFELL